MSAKKAHTIHNENRNAKAITNFSPLNTYCLIVCSPKVLIIIVRDKNETL